MAGLGGLPYYLQFQQQAQQQAIAAQDARMRQAQFQQMQQDRQRQQAALAAAGNALPQLTQQMQPPPPQTPPPGQSSQPMVQPGAQGGGGMPPPPQQQGAAPMPGQGPAPGPVKPPLPPFQAMPTSAPAPQAGPSSIGAPPAAPQQPPAAPQQPQGQAANDQMEGGFSLSNIIQAGQKQGLSGSDLYDYVQTLEPYMTAQQKAKADQFKTQLEIKKLDAEIGLHAQAAQNQQLSLAERQRHDEALERLSSRRADIAQGNLNARTGGGAATLPEPKGDPLTPAPAAGYSAEAIKALGEDYAVRGPSALSGFGNKNLPAAARTAIVNYAAAKNASTGQNFASNKVQYAADTAGARSNAVQAAKVDAAANALVQPGGIGDQYQGAIDALDRTGIPFANEAQMAILRKTNDPRIAAFDAAQNGVVSEAAQILGRGTLTVNSMEEARRVVDGWKTSDAARAGLAQLKKEAATTVKASSEEVARSAKTPKGQPGAQQNAKGWQLMTDKNGNQAYVSPDGKQFEEAK